MAFPYCRGPHTFHFLPEPVRAHESLFPKKFKTKPNLSPPIFLSGIRIFSEPPTARRYAAAQVLPLEVFFNLSPEEIDSLPPPLSDEHNPLFWSRSFFSSSQETSCPSPSSHLLLIDPRVFSPDRPLPALFAYLGLSSSFSVPRDGFSRLFSLLFSFSLY